MGHKGTLYMREKVVACRCACREQGAVVFEGTERSEGVGWQDGGDIRNLRSKIDETVEIWVMIVSSGTLSFFSLFRNEEKRKGHENGYESENESETENENKGQIFN